MTDSSLAMALSTVLSRVQNAMELRRSLDFAGKIIKPRLVAVSKTKPVESIIEVYQHGQKHFGENYVQEMLDKANNPKILQLNDIKWHFIGHLQRNKCNNLTGIPNLFMVETVDTVKLATALNNSWNRQNKEYRLKVMVQVNTSGEENKSGCVPSSCSELVKHIIESCAGLEFAGLMTIGALARSVQVENGNPDFEALISCRKDICEQLNLDVNQVELSMGMSQDFEKAVEMGSTNIRVGSTIFGARN